MKKNNRFLIFLIVIGAIVLFDQLVKQWASTVLMFAPGGVLPFIPGFISFRYMQNTGAAFSLFSGATWILGVISAVLAAVVIYFLWRGRKIGGTLYLLSLSFIAGGALGNVIDRFRLGYVVDMLEFQFVDFAIFNVADSFVCVGAVMFAICVLLMPDRRKQHEKQE